MAVEPAGQTLCVISCLNTAARRSGRGSGSSDARMEQRSMGCNRRLLKHSDLASLWDSREVGQRDVPVLCSAVVAQHWGGPLLHRMALHSMLPSTTAGHPTHTLPHSQCNLRFQEATREGAVMPAGFPAYPLMLVRALVVYSVRRLLDAGKVRRMQNRVHVWDLQPAGRSTL